MNLAESSPNNHEPYHVGCPRNEGQLCYQAIGVTGQQDFFHCLAGWDRRSLRGSIDLGRLVVEMLLKNYLKKIANNYMHSYYIYAFYCNHWTTLCIVPSVRVGCKLIVKTKHPRLSQFSGQFPHLPKHVPPGTACGCWVQRSSCEDQSPWLRKDPSMPGAALGLWRSYDLL